MDTTRHMRAYIARLGESHAKVFAKILAKREVATLDDLPNDDLFAFAEEFRANAGLRTGFMLARAAGISLLDDPNEGEVEDGDEPRTTAFNINQMALKLYAKADGESLRDAVADGATTREAMDQMGTAANTLRKMEAKRGDPTGPSKTTRG